MPNDPPYPTLGLKRPRFRGGAANTTSDTTAATAATAASIPRHSHTIMTGSGGGSTTSQLNHRKNSPRGASSDKLSSLSGGGTMTCLDQEKGSNHSHADHKEHDKSGPTPRIWGWMRSAKGRPRSPATVVTCGLFLIVATVFWTTDRGLSLASRSSALSTALPSRPPPLRRPTETSPRSRGTTTSGSTAYPRVVSLFPKTATAVDHNLPMYEMLPKLHHAVEPLAQEEFFTALADSADYQHRQADPVETRECKAQYDWQLHSFPSCNHLHEREFYAASVHDELALVANGYWRDVWVLPAQRLAGDDDHLVLKTLRYMHFYTERNYDRHRRDALAMERLTAHPYIVDIYAFCGNSGIFEFAGGGDIDDVIFPEYDQDDEVASTKRYVANVTKLERLHIAVQAAMGLAAVHNSDKEGRPAIAHTDISTGQFVRVNGIFKLNDFNRARFMLNNSTDGSLCTFEVGNNPGKNRSPEEYLYLPETEKVDVYSLGNIFYILLMDEWPFKGVSGKRARQRIAAGERSKLYRDVYESTDPILVALKKAMIMCHEQDPQVRATAREVETYLKEQMEIIDPGRLATWPQPVMPSS